MRNNELKNKDCLVNKLFIHDICQSRNIYAISHSMNMNESLYCRSGQCLCNNTYNIALLVARLFGDYVLS